MQAEPLTPDETAELIADYGPDAVVTVEGNAYCIDSVVKCACCEELFIDPSDLTEGHCEHCLPEHEAELQENRSLIWHYYACLL